MSKYRKNEEAIIRRVKQLKGPRPDFYIIGHSTSAMERLGLKIAEVIDRQEMLPFKGLVRTFTIKMPYYEDCRAPVLSFSISATATVLPETVMILTLAPLWLSWQKNGKKRL